ncbi:hypothetical protein CRM22_002975, partial [Opisthorchis felineus]
VQEERHRYTRVSIPKLPMLDTNANNSTPLSQASFVEHKLSDDSAFSGSPSISFPTGSSGSSQNNSTEAANEPTSRPLLPPVTTLTCLPELTLSSLLAAELSTDAELPTTEVGELVYVDIGEDNMDPLVVILHSVEEQLHRLLSWARQLPCFSQPYLSVDDQFWLLKSAVQEERHRYTRVSIPKLPMLDTNANNSTPLSQASFVEHKLSDDSAFSGSPSVSFPTGSSGSSQNNSTEAANEPTSRPLLPPVTTLTCLPELTLSSLLAAELSTDAELPTTEVGELVYVDIGEDNMDPLVVILHSVEEQLHRLLSWARQLPCFSQPYLSVDDQFWLLKSAWPELLLISAAFNSIVVNEGLLLANGRHLSRSTARLHGLGPLMDRFLTELVSRFRELGLERVELALLRAIILFNPGKPCSLLLRNG